MQVAIAAAGSDVGAAIAAVSTVLSEAANLFRLGQWAAAEALLLPVWGLSRAHDAPPVVAEATALALLRYPVLVWWWQAQQPVPGP